MKFSIKTKTVIIIVLFALALSSVSMWVCTRVIANLTDNFYRQAATELSQTVAKVVDKEGFLRVRNAVKEIYDKTEDRVGSWDWGTDEFNAYIARFSSVEESEDFAAVLKSLRSIQSVNNVDCIYLVYLDAASESFVYVVDAAEEDACPPGCFDEIYEVNRQILTDPEIGFPSYITNTEEYGWLVTAGSPVHAEDGTLIGYAMTDISMNTVRGDQFRYAMRVLLYLLVTIVLLCVVGIVVVNRILIKPVKKLTEAALSYRKDESSVLRHVFAGLSIKTGDEIEQLTDSMKKMENDINDHITSILSMKNELTQSKQLADEMSHLANVDALTGVHSKTAYNAQAEVLEELIKEGGARFGIAMIDLNCLKQINDTYGHEAGDEALILTCSTICDVFLHSPVFRVGGDEFVVVTQSRDYESAGDLIEQFKQKIKEKRKDASAEPWMRISAAIGYAEYDPGIDRSVSDVYERADKKMYENKKRMKRPG